MLYSLESQNISIKVDTLGAELKSLVNRETGREYMWEGNPKYWKRTSPVLFPIVGSLKNQTYIHDGKEYRMSQHGFARDMESALKGQDENSLWFELEYDEDTFEKYPFRFKLEIGYVIQEGVVEVVWKVKNLDNNKMYFSIGGHPAFKCPPDERTKRNECYLYFHNANVITSRPIVKEGLVGTKKVCYELKDGYLNIEDTLFDNDALIVENRQCQKVSLCDNHKKPYLTVEFDAPLFGVWSPVKTDAPFICIEPWYGRCDGEDFAGELKDRQWGNILDGQKEFKTSYKIEI